jgi:hypothetical protein
MSRTRNWRCSPHRTTRPISASTSKQMGMRRLNLAAGSPCVRHTDALVSSSRTENLVSVDQTAWLREC